MSSLAFSKNGIFFLAGYFSEFVILPSLMGIAVNDYYPFHIRDLGRQSMCLFHTLLTHSALLTAWHIIDAREIEVK